MKLERLPLLLAFACTLVSAQAQVAGDAATVVNEAHAYGQILYISGTSAGRAGLEQAALLSMFTGTTYTFVPSPASGRTTSDYRAYAGRLAATTGWSAGRGAIVIVRSRGGSAWGVNPVARGQPIESLVVTPTSCTAGTGSLGSPFQCNNLDVRVPDAGVSSMAPVQFGDLYNTAGEPAEPALTPYELATLTSTPIYGLAVGVAVTRNVPPTLKFNKAVVSSILTANLNTWSEVDAGLPADDVLICRHTNGSGTMAVANMYFGNYPCSTSDMNVPADRSSGSAWNGTSAFIVEGNSGLLDVVENSTSEGVRNCLDSAMAAASKPFNGAANAASGVGYTSYTTGDRSGNPVVVRFRDGRPHKAIGILSMDHLNASTTNSAWSFRSIDGAGEITWNGAIGTPPVVTGTGKHPTLENLVDGTWEVQGWMSFNVPSHTTGAKLQLIERLIATARRPAFLQQVPTLRWVSAALWPMTDDSLLGGQVLRAGYVGNRQCAPYNRY